MQKHGKERFYKSAVRDFKIYLIITIVLVPFSIYVLLLGSNWLSFADNIFRVAGIMFIVGSSLMFVAIPLFVLILPFLYRRSKNAKSQLLALQSDKEVSQ